MNRAALYRVSRTFRQSIRSGCRLVLLGRTSDATLVLAWLVIASLVPGCGGTPPRARSQCVSSPGDAAEVAQAVKAFYISLQTDDPLRVQELTTPDFFAYDGGMRFTAASLTQYLSEARARRMKFDWNLSGFNTHVSCDEAWTAYRNIGGIGDPDHYTSIVWLESAALARVGGRWRVQFLHSSRAKETP
jgi:hypothetical protein